MGYATLGPPGDTVTFRIDPEEVDWNFTVNTSVQDTVGGRVVQIVGSTLSDINVTGSYGERHHSGDQDPHFDGSDDSPGRSWRLAEAFLRKVRTWMDYQATQPNLNTTTRFGQSDTNPPLRFTYAPYGWDFHVYIKALADPDGGVVKHDPGKFSYKYSLTLFILEDNAAALGILRNKAAQAADRYIERISKGIGWERYDPKTDYFAEQAFSGPTINQDQQAIQAFTQAVAETGQAPQSDGSSTDDTPSSPSGSNGGYSDQQIAAFAYAAGFREGAGYQGHGLTWAVAVANAESAGISKPGAVNSDGSIDEGLWQVNAGGQSPAHPQYDAQKLNTDPAYCASAAWDISGHGNNWKPWATFDPGFDSPDPGGPSTPAGKAYAAAAKAVQNYLSTQTSGGK